VIEPIAIPPPHPHARITGVVYLLYFLTAIAGGLYLKGLVVPGDAAASANNILAHEHLYRAGVTVGVVSLLFYVALTALFYGLFKPVNRSISLLAAFIGLLGCACQAFESVFEFAPLAVLGTAPYLRAFTPEQLHALAMIFLKLDGQAARTALIFFTVYDLLIGWLILRSTFLPRILGVLMVLAGMGWLTFPYLPASVSAYLQVLGFVAELALMLWLLIKGVNVQRWLEQAGA